MIRYLVLLSLLLLNGITGFSQEKYKLSGSVKENDGRPLSTGDVVLMKPVDSSVVKLGMVLDGKFDLDLIEKGKYLLKVSGMGFHEVFRDIDLSSNTNVEIAMEVRASTLKEVKVISAKPVFTSKDGNIKMNIENTIFAEIPNILDLVSKLPGIQISPDKQTVSAVGRAEVILFLDNQRVSLNDLGSLSVRDIQNIEIINNPSVKYDADGRVVIAITRKMNKVQGFKTDISETVSIKRRFNNYLGINSSMRKDRLEVKANFQYNHLKIWESNSQDFNLPNYNLRSSYTAVSVENSPQFVGGIGAFYQINDDDYISINTNARLRDVFYPVDNNSYVQDGDRRDDIFTSTGNDNRRVYYNASANYSKKLKKINGQLFVGAQYSGYTEDLITDIYNQINDTPSVRTAYNDQKFRINSRSAKADFEQTLKNGMKWDIGANISQAKAKAISDIDNFKPPSSSFSFYDYSETTFAGYLQLSGKVKKVTYSGGLRTENTKIEGGFRDKSPLLLNKNQFYLFPKANVDIPLDSSWGLTLNYAKSIRRPNFSSLNQIVIYLSPFVEYARNINLNPTVTHDLSAGVRFKDKTLRVFYYWQKDPVYFGTEFNPSRRVLTMRDRNYAKEAGVNINLTYPFRYKKWSSTNVMVANFSKITDDAAAMNDPRPSLYVYSSNQFTLPNSYTLLVTAWYVTKRFTGLYERNAMSSVDIGASKSFGKFSCTVNFNDIFRGLNFVQAFDINDVYSKGTYYEDVREFSITFKYSFGKIKSAYKNVDSDINVDRVK
jgi:hypothetical protein